MTIQEILFGLTFVYGVLYLISHTKLFIKTTETLFDSLLPNKIPK